MNTFTLFFFVHYGKYTESELSNSSAVSVETLALITSASQLQQMLVS